MRNTLNVLIEQEHFDEFGPFRPGVFPLALRTSEVRDVYRLRSGVQNHSMIESDGPGRVLQCLQESDKVVLLIL